jgi:outer membrane lipoprotein carrier protein
VSLLRLFSGLLVVSAFAADSQLDILLRKVETRYNSAKTLQVIFTEQYTTGKGIIQPESGVLDLRKPGRMRWDYNQPKGKFWVSDGKFHYLYNPVENRVEKMKLKESEDMRAPLAFLLGK